jgi:hypothetical protein
MKSIGKHLFSASVEGRANPAPAYERVSARDLQLQESWFRDAIFDNPELVIAPCRAAGQVDQGEAWLPWAIEVNFGSGPIDVLLLSSYGRIGIVETKLSYNPQKRREVVAQVLDYALSLQDVDRDDLPALPASDLLPDDDDLTDALASGKFLLIIAGDELDPRAMRLSQSLLARHLTNEWDLAMIDLNVFRSQADASLLVVPELLGGIQSDVRQVVRVRIEGENPRARVEVEHVTEQNRPSSRATSLASLEAFLSETAAKQPELLALSQTITELFLQESSESGGRISVDFGINSINLFLTGKSGPARRFLSLKTDGRVIVVFRYMTDAGYGDLAQSLEGLSRPLMRLRESGHSAETKLDRSNLGPISDFVKAACSLVRSAK